MDNKLLNNLKKIINNMDEKLGQNTIVLDLNNISSLCDYFVVTSAASGRQTRAIADEIQDTLAEEGVDILHKEGYDTARWILLDYGDIVIHVFHKEDREFYNLEGIWKDAKIINIDKIIEDNI